MTSSGQYKIDNYYAQKSHLLTDYTPLADINKGSKYNTLKAVKVANTITYYINGKEVAKNSNNNINGGRLAFFLGGRMEIEVDYIKVTKSPSAIDLVENAHKIKKKERLSDQINSEYDELAPIISADGKTLFVCRNGHPANTGGNDIWYSNLDENGAWTTLKKMGWPLNNEGQNFVVSIAPDNNRLIVANTYQRDGSRGGNGLSVSHKTRQGWGVPKPMQIDDFYNKDKFVAYFLCPDNKTLIMSVQRQEGFGVKDLYVSFLKEDGGWTSPKNMGQTINTFENEVNPFVAADNETLYFASQGHPGYGHHDIFVSKRLDDTWTNWSKPKNLGPQINSHQNDFSFFVEAAGDYAYLGSAGDIWKIENPAKPAPIVLIKGRVLNQKTNAPMGVEIKYQDLTEGKELGIATSDPITGEYQIALPAGKKYGYQAEKEGFYAISNAIDLVDLEEYGEKTVDLYLKPMEKGTVVRLNNIFFEFDKAILKTASYTELNRLYTLLHENEHLKIEIAGHTDDKGSSSYNLSLSQQRAESVVQYLIDKGIATQKLKAVGYGKSKPLVANSSEENRAFNRRVEFRIL